MGSYTNEALKQLELGDGETLYGNTPLAILKVLLQSGSMIKAYGRVRRRTVDTFNRFIDNVMQILFLYEKDKDNGFPVTKDTARRSVDLISGEEDGIVREEKLVNDILSGRKT